MCGIAGVIGLGEDLGERDRGSVQTMVQRVRHRGPDQQSLVEDRRCILGNARLRVVDLSSAADLPLTSADGRISIAYNGEVTNFRDLEEQYRLREKYEFKSSSDTETLLHLYEELGIDFCRELTGMFAFALHDRREEKVWIVRDQFGNRPLFLMRTPRRIYFASEIKAFLELPEFRADIDLEGLFHYFTLAYIPGRHTPFECVEELQGGERLQIDLSTGRTEDQRYYRVHFEADRQSSFEELRDGLYEQMLDSVRRNLIADAPLGLTLSGGFDTSSILALARECIGPQRDLHSYSVVMGEKSFNEARWQQIMVEFANTIHHEIHVGPRDVMEVLVEHMAYLDEPSANGAAIPSYLLAREATKDVTVLLSGEGGDETFTAYETHRAWKVRHYWRRFAPGPLRKLAHGVAHALPTDYRKLSFDFMAKRFTEGAEMDVAQSHIHWRYTIADADKRRLMPKAARMIDTGDWAAKIYDSYPFTDELDRICALDAETYLIGDLMVKNDRTFMAHSIEARFPYMDRILYDYMSRVPPELRLKGMKGRYLQKEAMRGHIPEAISGRKNMGLEMPHSLWFLGDLKPVADEYFSREKVERTGFLTHAGVDHLWQEHLARKRDNGRALWSILMVLIWFDLFVAEGTYKQYLTAREPRASV
ncbi:MAG: asparagine synthase (glutamine-hydrolyzing) [Deltaproteobacteria bacterium]|nr:asparagine synthase (glutamine-hydrolyzing) [Deltaproteobacteria bacterium]